MRKGKEGNKYIPGNAKDSSELKRSLQELLKNTEQLLKDLETNK
jgi:hypothetical protein